MGGPWDVAAHQDGRSQAGTFEALVTVSAGRPQIKDPPFKDVRLETIESFHMRTFSYASDWNVLCKEMASVLPNLKLCTCMGRVLDSLG